MPLEKRRLISNLVEATNNVSPILREARNMQRFRGGDQWDPSDRKVMEEEGRPALVIDQTGPVIDAVGGSETVNRFEPDFLPMSASLQDTDLQAAEAVGEVYRKQRTANDYEHHESRCYRDACTTGGPAWTETFFSSDDVPDGEIKTQWVNQQEVAWDPTAEHTNVTDARYIVRGRWMDFEEFESFFPERATEAISFASTLSTQFPSGFMGNPGISRSDGDYSLSDSSGVLDKKNRRILTYEHQYFEREDYSRVFAERPVTFESTDEYADRDPDGLVTIHGQGFVSSADFDRFQLAAEAAGEPPRGHIIQSRKLYRQAFMAGNEILSDDPLIVNDFTYLAITGFDKQGLPNGGMRWQGLVERMLDSQKLTNKTLSNLIWLFGQNPSALIAEEDAFVDESQAEKDINNPSKTVYVHPNVLKEGRVQPKLGRSPVPAGYEQLLSFAMEAGPRTVGLNNFMLGFVGDLRRTPAQSINSVQRQALTNIAPLMDNLRLYRKMQAKLVVKFIQSFFSVQHIARILPPELKEYAPLVKSRDISDYDIVIDESQSSPNAQMELRNDMIVTNFLGEWMSSGRPIPPSLFANIGLPSTVAREMQQIEEQRMAMMQMQAQAAQQGQPVQ